MKLKTETQIPQQPLAKTDVEPTPANQPDERTRVNTLDEIATDSHQDAETYVLKSRAPLGE